MNPSVGIRATSSSALITSIVILITMEYISKMPKSHNVLQDWNKVASLLYEKTLKQSKINKGWMNKS